MIKITERKFTREEEVPQNNPEEKVTPENTSATANENNEKKAEEAPTVENAEKRRPVSEHIEAINNIFKQNAHKEVRGIEINMKDFMEATYNNFKENTFLSNKQFVSIISKYMKVKKISNQRVEKILSTYAKNN